MNETRPNPDELLARVQAEEAKSRRGKLKIFFGAAPGVGKTYAMLEAARKIAKEGANVIVGYVEPHARPETQALVLGLDVLPKRTVTYRGRQLLEFDLDAALAEKPQLIVVDELAHTNLIDDERPLVHAKRWQDIQALLAAGIDVYTTVNVQHLESLNDVVAKITGVVVRETVPDTVFEQADEVELVDLAPDDLIDRLREGKVYVPGQAAKAIDHFFNKGNLIALRELAFRKMAERVDRQMTDYRKDQAIQQTWPAADRLLVCITPGPTSASLVRATRRMAASIRSPWIAVHVETPADGRLSTASQERLADTLNLARRLGGEVVTLGGADATGEIIAYARQRNVTKIIVGKTLRPRWREILFGSFLYKLTRRCGDIDVYVIRGEEESSPRRTTFATRPTNFAAYAIAIATVLICSALCWILLILFSQVSIVTLCMVYLVGVVAIASWYGRGPAILTSCLGVLAFDFFFVPPYLTFAVHDTQYFFTFLVMLATGLLVSTLTSRLTFQAHVSRQREQQATALGQLSRALVEIDDLAHLRLVRDQLEHVLSGEAFVFIAQDQGGKSESPLTLIEVSPGTLDVHERAVADWVHKHGEAAGFGTDTLPSVSTLLVPLVVGGKIPGVLGARPCQSVTRFSPDQLRLIDAAAGQLALAVQRIQSADAARQSQLRYEREQLRSALLSAVSHDLRTPLAAIAGSASTLRQSGRTMSEEVREDLLDSIVAETDRLNRLIANLLDMTRLEAGSVSLQRDWHPLDDLIAPVAQRLTRVLENHQLIVDLPPDPLLVYLDELLFHQVLTNLLENAARYSPRGTQIKLSAGHRDGSVWLELVDTGPGFPPQDVERIFEKFYRGAQEHARSGTGLGLAICRGIVELHGGTIRASNRPGGGATFRIELPQPPQPPLAIPAEAATT
jgi:two-component system, OmpR family, sensor histidine kinase KdpD